MVEDALRHLDIDDPGEPRRPFLEVAVQLDGVEPGLRRRIDMALAGKPVRLTRVVRHTAGQGGTLADAVESSATLDTLDPAHVFARRHAEEYRVEPPGELRRAFNEVLMSIVSPATERGGVR
jgi:exonuclease SbcD